MLKLVLEQIATFENTNRIVLSKTIWICSNKYEKQKFCKIIYNLTIIQIKTKSTNLKIWKRGQKIIHGYWLKEKFFFIRWWKFAAFEGIFLTGQWHKQNPYKCWISSAYA